MKKILIYFLVLCFTLSLISCQAKIEADGPEILPDEGYKTVEELISVLQEDPNIYGDILIPHMITKEDEFSLAIFNYTDGISFRYVAIEPENESPMLKPHISVYVHKGKMSFEEMYKSNRKNFRVREDGAIRNTFSNEWRYDMGDVWISVAYSYEIDWYGWESLHNYFTFERLDFPEREYEEEKNPWIYVGVIAAAAVAVAVPTTLLILHAKRRRQAKNN